MKASAHRFYLWMAYNIFSVHCLFFHKMHGRPRSLECELQQNVFRRRTGCAVACMEQDFGCQLFVYETDDSNCYKCKISSTNTSQWSSRTYGAVIEPSTGKWVPWRWMINCKVRVNTDLNSVNYGLFVDKGVKCQCNVAQIALIEGCILEPRQAPNGWHQMICKSDHG